MEKKILRKKTEVKAKEKPVKESKKKVLKKINAAPLKTFGLGDLKAPPGAHKRKKLLGRGPGSGHGKTSTRGSKGQTSRSGRDFYPGFEGGQTPLIRRMPKRGFTSVFKKEFQIVNLDQLSPLKESIINPGLLEEKGIIKSKDRSVKILGDGEIKNPLTISAHAFSKQAAEKIQKAGGKIEIINDVSS